MHPFCSMFAKLMIDYNQIYFINLLTQFALCFTSLIKTQPKTLWQLVAIFDLHNKSIGL
jgi:hypothetical protein